ncbi:hypothetical protein JCM33374_g2910 [Metschnikowia sp. JCM 33374]|nr:hypothetical protein JCM33374_g2910 [Metschnikowia sp. JCM 33374]
MSSVPEWIEKWEPKQSAVEPPRIPKEELLETLKTAPKSVTVVDLRNELERAYITKAVHIPATKIHGPEDVQEKLVAPVLEKYPETEKIIIHCNSSAKRASFVGGWAKEKIDADAANGAPKVDVEILHEGIVGWLSGDESFKSETTYVNKL